MALINCKECGKEISDKAKTCPNCGIALNDAVAKEINAAKKVAIFVIAVLGLIVIYNLIVAYVL